MGHLITFASTGMIGAVPEWFQIKWSPFVGFGPEMYCKSPHKYWGELENDIQKAMQETWKDGLEPHLTLVYVNECGNVDRVDIRPDEIRYSEPSGWREINQLRLHEAWDACERPWPYRSRRIKKGPIDESAET